MMGAVGFERRAPFLIDQPGRCIGKPRAWIVSGGNTLDLKEQRPTLAETLQHIVEPRRHRNQFGLGGAGEVGTAIADGALERAVLVQHNARRHQKGPGQIVGKVCCRLTVFGKVQHESAPLCREWRERTVRNAGSLRVTQTAMA